VSHTRLGACALIALLTACGGDNLNNQKEVELEELEQAEVGPPKVLISDSALDFGRVKLGGSSAESLTITNTGTGPLTIYAFALEVAGEFQVLAEGGLVIPAQGSAGITIKYLPIDYANDDITLTVATNDPGTPDAIVRLEGKAVTDADDDGFDSLAAGGDDCDDDNPMVNPEAEDPWYDGEDSNCDNADDFDQDGDGYQVNSYNDEPAGGGGDCQDSNPDMYPGADDEWYDGIDSDCDGSNDYDQDGDGFDALSGGGDDCDDLDPMVNPDNAEKLNGLDDDCNGWADDSVPGWNADRAYPGPAADSYAGYAITLGDLDSDGDNDLIVGGYAVGGGQGGIGIFDGGSVKPDGTDIQSGHSWVTGAGGSDQFGFSLAYLEQSGAFPEPYLAVGAPNGAFGYGMVYLFTGDSLWGATTSSAVYTIEGAGGSDGYLVGRGLTQDLDLDGDGAVDLMGYYSTGTSSAATPMVWLFYGDNWDSASTGSATLADADARYSTDGGGSGASYYNRMQFGLSNGGDGNGDGYDDFIFCDHFVDTFGINDGALWMLWGSSDRYSNTSSADLGSTGDVVATGSVYDKGMSMCQFVDDVDGDGDQEFVAYVINSGVLHLFEGGADLGDSILREEDAWAQYEFGNGAQEPTSIRLVGDWSGDGVSEIGVGQASSGAGGGSLFIISPDTPGVHDADDSFSVIEGDTDYFNANYGTNLSSRPGDYNGDGAIDLIVGDYGFGDTDSGKERAGSVFVTYGN